jgi:TRAP-type mannitol/chloroaromatic compound transport system permease large subunit
MGRFWTWAMILASVALPAMLKRKYDPQIALGSIMAGGTLGILFLMMVLLAVLGMFLDWVGILLLAVPIFVPIIKSLSFDGLFGLAGVPADDVALWFGVIYLVNMQMSFLSQPFGYALFYIRGVCPPEISMATIFKSSLVFLLLQTVGLALCVLIPGLRVWLPNLVYG